MKRKIHLILALLLPVQIVVVKLLTAHPRVVERFFSNGIFPLISRIERITLGWIPFSIGDFLYIFTAILLLRWLYLRIKTRFKSPKEWGLQLLSTLSVIYFLFHFLWGLNYYRLPLYKILDISNQYNSIELVTLTEKLIEKSNKLQEKLTGDSLQSVNFDFNKKEIRTLAVEGYKNITSTYPEFQYRSPSVKNSIFSLPLTYMGFSGYLNPFTNEAQINYKVPTFRKPTLVAHEIGHEIGFAKENEANFMAALTTINHPNPYFRYSGYTFALQYCYGDLAARNPEEARKLYKQIHPGVKKNFEEIRDFWDQYQNPAEPLFKLFYGHYLKANNQPGGMQTYNYVVALLVNYFKDKNI